MTCVTNIDQLIPVENLIPAIDHPGFFMVPHLPDVAVSRDGDVIDTITGLAMARGKPESDWPYKYITVRGHGNLLVHRLVAKTFLECTIDPEVAVVNHLDGDKFNNKVENLEWTTRSGNAIHAYMTGLRSDNKVILSKDLESGAIVAHYSLQETARYFKVNGITIHNYLKSERSSPFKKKYVLTEKGSEFPPLTKENINRHMNGMPKAVMAFVEDTNDVRIFESVGCAAEYFGVKMPALFYHLAKVRGTDKFVNHLGHDWCFVSDYKGPVAVDEVDVIGRPKKTSLPTSLKTGRVVVRPPKPISVEDLLTGEITVWSSTQAFADRIGVKKNTLQKRMLTHNGIWDRYQIRYTDQMAVE